MKQSPGMQKNMNMELKKQLTVLELGAWYRL